MTMNDLQLDTIKEIINIGVGQAANMLNMLLKKHIVLKVPLVKLVNYNELTEEIILYGEDKLSAVDLSFKGIVSGSAKLYLSYRERSKIGKHFY